MITKSAMTFFLMIFFSSIIHSEEWKTDFFNIVLPDNMEVEVDSSQRIFGSHGDDYPPKPPILIIDFTEDSSKKSSILSDINKDLELVDVQLKKGICKPSCELYSGEYSEKIDGMEVFIHNYLMVTSELLFVIVYVNEGGYKEGREFVNEVLNQLKVQSN